MASNPGLLISEILTNPNGNDSPFEYVELLATGTINFSTTPYSVVFEDSTATPSNGWITGGAVSYGFNITSGTVNAGDVVYVGGSSMAGDAGAAPNDFRLYNWTGNLSDAPLIQSTLISGFNPEAIVALPSDSLTGSLTGSNLIQLISDDGAATVYNDGTASKDLGQNNFKKFRTDLLGLSDTSNTNASYTFTGNGRTSVVGTSINDSITGNPGAKTLTGGAGNDRFIYNSIKDAGQTISDFTVGQDKIVLTQLLSSIGYSGNNPIADGYVQIVPGSSSATTNSILQIDRDGLSGAAILRPFIQINNITATAMNNVNNFVF